MELRLLRYFLAVAREQNITRAARSLHIAQPSLSKQLMELEQRLGKRLFERGKRKIALTEAGIMLYKRANEIIMLCEKAEREIAWDDNLIGGDISLAGASSPVVAEAVSQMAAAYPNVKFRFLNGDAEQIGEWLDNGTLDFGILLEPVDITKYEHLPLQEEDILGLLLRKDCALAAQPAIRPQDIASAPLVIPQRVGLQREISAWAGKEIEQLNVIATFDILFNSPMLLIKRGLGYGMIFHTLIDTNVGGELCFRPLEPPIKKQYGLVWKRYPVFSKAALKFIETVKRCQENAASQ